MGKPPEKRHHRVGAGVERMGGGGPCGRPWMGRVFRSQEQDAGTHEGCLYISGFSPGNGLEGRPGKAKNRASRRLKIMLAGA